jgi:hypothetical protein
MKSFEFVSWLEGYLDACKGKPTPNQIKEIRKKIKELHENTPKNAEIIPIYDSSNTKSENYTEFLKEVESKKSASTLNELS